MHRRNPSEYLTGEHEEDLVVCWMHFPCLRMQFVRAADLKRPKQKQGLAGVRVHGVRHGPPAETLRPRRRDRPVR